MFDQNHGNLSNMPQITLAKMRPVTGGRLSAKKQTEVDRRYQFQTVETMAKELGTKPELIRQYMQGAGYKEASEDQPMHAEEMFQWDGKNFF